MGLLLMRATVRGPMDGFVGCVIDKSARCATKEIAGCMYATISGSRTGGGGSGRALDVEKVKECCEGRSHAGRWDAVEMVAKCHVDVCMGGE